MVGNQRKRSDQRVHRFQPKAVGGEGLLQGDRRSPVHEQGTALCVLPVLFRVPEGHKIQFIIMFENILYNLFARFTNSQCDKFITCINSENKYYKVWFSVNIY